MAITFTAGTSVESTGSVTSTTVTLPSGLTSGDYTIIVVSLNASNGSITTPSGWTNILASTNSVNGSTSDAHAIFYRKWVSGDTNPAVTTTNGRVAATPIRVQGADATTFVDVSATVTQAASGATTLTAPSITPSSTTLVCTFNGRNASNGNFLTPFSNLSASMTQIAEASGKSTSQTNAGHCIAYEVVTSGSATGTRQANPAVATTGAMGVSFSLKSAGGTNHTGSPADDEDVTDSATAVQELVRERADSEGITDSATPVQEMARTQADSEGITDSVSAVLETPGLALDASTPALTSASATAVTTASFTPPAGALLLAVTSASAGSQANPTVAITNSGTGVSSWTLVDRATVTTTGATGVGGGVASMHWAKVNTSGSMTVTSTQTNGSAPTYFKVWVITGADTTSPIGDTDIGFTTNNTMVTGTMTTTRDGSWKTAVGTEWSAAGTAGPNHPDLDIGTFVYDDTTDILVGAGGAKLVPTSGSNVTCSIDAAGTAAREWLWVAAEIRKAASGTDYDKNPADSEGITDSASSIQEIVRGPADAEGLTDSTAAVQDVVREHADAEGVTDAVSASMGFDRTPSDAEGLTDAAAAVMDAARTSADTEPLTDAVTAVQGASRAIADPAGLADTATAVQGMGRTVADAAGLSDVIALVYDIVRAPADPVGITDNASASITGSGTAEVSDTAGITDSVQAIQEVLRTWADTVGMTDAATTATGFARTLADAEALADAVTVLQAAVRSLGDSVGLVDVASDTLDATRPAADSAGLSDSVTASLGMDRVTGDTAGLTDAVTTSLAMGREAGDLAGLSDTIQTIMGMAREVADTVGITDSVSAVLGSSLKDLLLSAVPLGTRWTIAALAPRWSHLATSTAYSAVPLTDTYESIPLAVRWAASPIPGETMAAVEVLASAGAAKYVGGTVTETTGKDISGATFRISLGSEFQPGRTWLTPDISLPGATPNIRVVKYLVSSTTPSGLVIPGTYWAWVRVTDAPEIEPIRVQGPIEVR